MRLPQSVGLKKGRRSWRPFRLRCANSENKPRHPLFEVPMLNNSASTERPRDRRRAGLYEINGNGTIHRAQDTGRNFDNARKDSRVANRTNPFWTVPSVRAEVLCSAQRVQRLALLRAMFVAKALRVKRAVEMIAGVWVPSAIRPRHHDENLSFLRTPHPQSEPKVRALPNCHRVQMFAWKRTELHQTDLEAGASC